MEKVRILFVVYELPPLGGGVATAASHLLGEFKKHNNLQIDVITSSLNNRFEKEQLSENIHLYKVPIGSKPPDRYQQQTVWEMLRFTIGSLLQAIKLLNKFKYNLAHYFGYPGGLPGLLLKKRMSYVVSLRGVDVPGYNLKFGWYYRIYKPLSKIIWRNAKTVVVNSRWLEDLAKKTLDRSYLVIPNGVDTNLFKPVPETDKFKQFTVTAGGTVMGPKKGLEYLVEGFAIFHKLYPDSRLRLFGTGVLESKLRQMASDLGIKSSVEFVGRVSHDELARQLPRCHVMCLPSLAEGMSNAVLEAAACGLPLILTAVGGTEEILDGNQMLVKKKDAGSVASALIKIARDKKLRDVMENKSRSIAETSSWSEMSSSYRRLYK